MNTAQTWQGEGRLAFGESFATRATIALHRNGSPAGWTGEVILAGAPPLGPGDRIELTVGRSPCRAIVRETVISGGAGHRTTTLRVEGDGPPPAPLR